jgi:hypothetical protein
MIDQHEALSRVLSAITAERIKSVMQRTRALRARIFAPESSRQSWSPSPA